MLKPMLFVAAFTASPAAAQLFVVPPPVDLSPFATTAQVSAALAAKADAATVAGKADAAALPPICTQPPAADAMVATAGTGLPCTSRIDAARQSVVPPASATTIAGGSFSGTWPTTLAAAPSRVIATVEGSTPKHCQIVTKTATAFTGMCWDIAPSITLGSALGELLNAVKTILTPTAAGTVVTILYRQ